MKSGLALGTILRVLVPMWRMSLKRLGCSDALESWAEAQLQPLSCLLARKASAKVFANSDARNSLAKAVSVSNSLEYRDLSQGNLASIWQRLACQGDSPHSYWLTRFIILRMLGLVYFVAFLSLAQQILPLIGSRGLLPVNLFLRQAEKFLGSRSGAFIQFPSIFWIDSSDFFLVVMSWVGVVLSAALLLGFANGILLLSLWAIYLSFVHIGQDWYSYGWEIQLLETGFLAVFLCPLLDGRPFPKRPPPAPVIWLFRWLIFRIMLGAGLIKLRGDSCWRDLTCLYYHYETQPIPNPLSPLLHFMPQWFHKLGALWNHLNELIVPWFMFGPRRLRHVAGFLLVSFQIILILSGNLSFLNWVTIIPALACFDDSWFARILPKGLTQRAVQANAGAKISRAQYVVIPGLVLLVAVLSFYPVANLVSRRQAMNTSFDPLHLVNTYGAFGSVGQERNEIIFEGSDDAMITPESQWKAYEFKCKPSDPFRRPCVISPYHYRLDWQIWFAAMSGPDQYPWTLHFVWKLLHNDSGVLSLLANNPFPNSPPRHIRAELYRYQFAPWGEGNAAWWARTRLGSWLPALSVRDPSFLRFLAAYGWVARANEKDDRPD